MPRRDLLTDARYVFDVFIPRCFGLLPLRYNVNTKQFVPSRPGLIACNLCGLLFICIYPLAVFELLKNRPLRENEDSMVGRIMIASHYVFMYVLSLSVFLRQMFFSTSQMHSMNRSIKFYQQCNTLCEIDVGEFIYPFILRGICSYFGYATINYFVLFYFYGDLSHVNWVYKFLFFMPYVVISSTMIRFHSGAMHLTICGRRLNHAFNHCIESINAAHDKPAAELDEVCTSAMTRFDYLTWFHGEWCEIARSMEKGLSLLMLLIVTNALMNLTQTVLI